MWTERPASSRQAGGSSPPGPADRETRSSGDQSSGFLNRRSEVRILPGLLQVEGQTRLACRTVSKTVAGATWFRVRSPILPLGTGGSTLRGIGLVVQDAWLSPRRSRVRLPHALLRREPCARRRIRSNTWGRRIEVVPHPSKVVTPVRSRSALLRTDSKSPWLISLSTEVDILRSLLLGQFSTQHRGEGRCARFRFWCPSRA
jgi:hypothetical protein